MADTTTASEIRVSGRVSNPRNFTENDLKALPAVTETLTFQSRESMRTATFTGVPLREVIKAAGNLINDGHGRLDRLEKYIVARGASGFAVVISWGEIDPICANTGILVAYEMDGQPLGPSEGMARLVVPGDAHGARFVSQLAELQVCGIDS
jgi:DMSO/TMAO reductase YedYZ molybdopterin-dependent catalytic subunit